jgi:small subunit ribosomal protein S1
MNQADINQDRQETESGQNGTKAGQPVASTSRAEPRHPMEAILRSNSSALVKIGDIVEGTVIEKKGGKLFIDLGPWGVGVVYGREYYAAEEIVKAMSAGDQISAKVVDLDNDEGYKELSLQEAGREKRWLDLKKLKDENTVLDLPVLKANTGGLILQLSGVEGFLPASQLSSKNYPRVDNGDKDKIYQELQKLVGKLIKVRVLDLDPHDNKLIFTEKGLSQEAIRGAISRYKVGDIVEGTITGVVDFGAFMKFNTAKKGEAAAEISKEEMEDGDTEPAAAQPEEEQGIEGLIHLSEIDWSLIENPREVLKPGDHVRAQIIEIQGDKISLSLKRLKEDPWSHVAAKYQKGTEITGMVTRLNHFGAFVEVEKDIQGLAHVSEFGTEKHMAEVLKVGERYPFTILLIEPKDHRMSLGMGKKEKAEVSSAE